jgi:hypothetical protein
MRTWLLRLGFIGDEFATARELLTKNLDGDTPSDTAETLLEGFSLRPPSDRLRRS